MNLISLKTLIGLTFLSIVPNVYPATTEEVKDVAKDLVCLCGNCPRESLATCLCTDFAIPERAQIGQQLDKGKTKNEIINEYRARFGDVALATPPVEGINILAWVVPITALLFGALYIRSFTKKRMDQVSSMSENTSGISNNALDTEQQKRLRFELDEFEKGE